MAMNRICTFCGHASTPERVRPILQTAIEKIIADGTADVFYVGGQGRFDGMALGILKRLQETHPMIQYYEILAYMPGLKDEFGRGAPTIYPEGMELVPKKFAIIHRNRWMVEQADCIIAYVQHSWGGAAQTLSYARRRGLAITNLAEIAK